jgi:type II secretory pathway component PulF
LLKRSAYPLFVLHFGIFAVGLPTLLFGGGVQAFLQRTVGLLFVLYAIAAIIALSVPLLADLGANSGTMDALLRAFPMLGKMRRSLAVSRFCATYEMQLDAGVNVLDALASAARASRSGLIHENVRRALPEVRSGGQVGPLLAQGRGFPLEMLRAFSVGEDSGQLGPELDRMALEYREEGLQALDTFADWLPKLLYFAILIYLGYGIIAGYQQIWASYDKILNF